MERGVENENQAAHPHIQAADLIRATQRNQQRVVVLNFQNPKM